MADEGAGAPNNEGGCSSSEPRIPGQPKYQWGPHGVAAGMVLDQDGTQFASNIYKIYANRTAYVEGQIAAIQRDFNFLGLAPSYISLSLAPGSSSPQLYGFGALTDVPEIRTAVLHLFRIVASAHAIQQSKSALREVCDRATFVSSSPVRQRALRFTAITILSSYPLV
jgi:hypothetical protein